LRNKKKIEEQFTENDQQIIYKEKKLNDFLKNKIAEFELVSKIVHSMLLLAELGCEIDGFVHADFWVEKSRIEKIIFVLVVNVHEQVYNRIKNLLDKEIKKSSQITCFNVMVLTPQMFRNKWGSGCHE
jgi:hypothetical protein